MIYPVKLEFKIYPSGAWEDWSRYLSEPPSVSRKVESDNPGEAGLIVFDKASVSLYYTEENPVFEAFQTANLTSAQRYLFRISAHNSSGVYIPLFEGMVDFSTIEWPDKSRLITFEILDKLSAISILEAKKCKTLTSLKNASFKGLPSLNYADGEYYVITVGTSLISQGIIHIEKYIKVGGILTRVIVNQTLKILNAGEILFAGNPLDEESGKFYFPTASILKDNGNDNIDTYVFGTSDSDDVSGVYRIDSNYSDAYKISDPSIKLKYYPAVLYGYEFQKISNLPPPGFPLDATDTVIGFDGVKTIMALVLGQWSSALIDRMGEFIIPLEYWKQLIFEDPFSETPLDALKMLADSMRCYIYFDKEGKLVVQKKSSLATNGTARSLGSTRIIDAAKKFFWDKLIDGVTVEVKSWVEVNEEYLTGTGSLYKQITGSNSYVKPKNELTKKTLAGSSSMDTQGELDSYAALLAGEYMSFYGVRRECWSYQLNLDDNTFLWDLLDNITVGSKQYFFTNIDYNLSDRTLDIEFVDVEGADYDLRQVAITQSARAYSSSSSGGSYSGGGETSPSDYLWSGTAVGLNASLARQSLGLKNIANLGDGIISNTEFNYLDGVTSNIQTQLNSKESVLSFTDPLVRTGNQISITTGAFSLGANTDGFALTGNGKPVGGDIALAFPQRLDTGGTPQFERLGAGGPAHATFKMMVAGDQYNTGFLLIDGYVYVGGTGRIARLGLGTDADASLSLKTAAGVYIAGDLTVAGNIYQSGTAYLVDAQHLQVESNIIYVNKNEQGGGVTNGIAGIEVERGSSTNYQFVFNESDDTFRLGMAGSLQAAATRQDSPVINGVAYWNSSAFRFDTSANLKFDGTHLAIGGAALTEALNVSGNVSQTGSSGFYNSFISGYLGAGWKIWKDANGSYLEIDNIVVRNSFRTHIFQKDVVRASNGYLFITDCGQIAAETLSSDGYIYLDESALQNGDLAWYKDIESDGAVIAGIKIIISSEGVYTLLPNSAKYGYKYNFTIYSGSGTFRVGGTVVRAGSSIAARQGSVYFDASSASAPFMDIYDGVNTWTAFASVDKLKARIGKLDGVTDAYFGALSGYGIYSNRAFFTEDVLIGGRSLGLLSGMTGLFHFDDNLYDSISGIKPNYSGALNETSYGLISSSDNTLVATKTNGKFGGGVAVEEATTNMLGVNDASFENGSGSWGIYYGIAGFERSSSYAMFGSYSIKINGNGSATGGVQNANAAGARWAVSANTTYTISGYALSPSLRLTRLWIRQYDASGNLITNTGPGQIAPLSWSRQSYTFTTTSTTASIIVDMYVYNLASGESVYWDGLQLEQKYYASSFTEGSRSAGALLYSNLINPASFTIRSYVNFDLSKTQGFARIFEISSDTSNRLFLAQKATTNNLRLYFAKAGATVFDLDNSAVAISAGWHDCTLVFDGGTYYLYVDGVEIYKQASAVQIISSWTLKLGYGVSSNYVNGIFDEFAVFSRGLSVNEIKKIYYSGQPLQESPGMTYISGNKIRTGMMYSENYVAGVSGSMWNLNTGYLETNDGWFRGTITANSGLIGGWNITERWINKTLATVNGYLLKLDTMTTVGTTLYERPRLEIGWGDGVNVAGYGGNYITLGASSYMQSTNGIFTTPSGGAWDINDGCGGLSVNVNGENILFAGRRKLVDETYKSGAAIAGWNFDKSAFWTGAKGSDGAYTTSGITLGAGFISAPNTYISSAGILYTKSANIGGWSIDASAIFSGTRGANGAYTTSGMTIGSAGYISSPNTFISSSGVLYSKSGNIAGFAFDSGKLNVSTDFVLDAAGKKLYFNNKSTYASANTGIFLGLDGTAYKFIIGSSTKYLAWDGTNLTALGAEITGATITGGLYQSAGSGNRIELSTSGLVFYGSFGVYRASINRDTTATAVIYDAGTHKFTSGDIEILDGRIYSMVNSALCHNTVFLGTFSSPPNAPAIGDIYYDTSIPGMRMWTSPGWKTITLT